MRERSAVLLTLTTSDLIILLRPLINLCVVEGSLGSVSRTDQRIPKRFKNPSWFCSTDRGGPGRCIPMDSFPVIVVFY